MPKQLALAPRCAQLLSGGVGRRRLLIFCCVGSLRKSWRWICLRCVTEGYGKLRARVHNCTHAQARASDTVQHNSNCNAQWIAVLLSIYLAELGGVACGACYIFDQHNAAATWGDL